MRAAPPPPSPWIGFDGRSLILGQGTGVFSYSYGLAEAVGRLGYQREVLLDRPLAPDGSRVLHSPRLTLINKSGHIGGYFDGTDPAAVGRLKTAAERLAREAP